MPTPESIRDGQRLARAMCNAGLNRYQLAHLSKLTTNLVGAYLEGRKSLADDGHARHLANLLGVSVRWLLTGVPSKAAADAVKCFRRLPHFQRMAERDQALMVAFLEMLPAGDELAEVEEAAGKPLFPAEAACEVVPDRGDNLNRGEGQL
jgi:hypothetical protein